VAEAFKLILADEQVKGVLVKEVPVVVRLEGTHAELGREILERSGLRITAATDLTEAARTIVALVEAS